MASQTHAGTPLWRIELLGGLRAIQSDRVIARFAHQKAAALLACLALAHAAEPRRPGGHLREELVELLWPEIDRELGRGKLRFMLHSLRQQLERSDPNASSSLALSGTRLLIADRSTLRLDPVAFTTDVAEFRAALQAAPRIAAPGERAQLLGAAAALYQGELLPGFFEPWVLAERQHLAESHLELLQQLATALEEAGDPESALAYAQQAVSIDPLREEAHYLLMRLYAAAGQPSATLHQYHELERLLREELGETPSAASRTLAEELRQSARSVLVARSGHRAEPPPPAPAAAPRASPPALPGSAPRLPTQFTRFFGREEEIARVTEALRIPGARLVTLTGPGGSGKTRLAVAVAGRLQEEFAGALWYVPLAELTEARLIPEAIVSGMGLPRTGQVEPLEQAIRALERATEGAGSGAALLVLDNFEQLVEEGALVVRALIEQVPRLTCLVTSRQRLELAGEQEFVVLPLPTPGVPAGSLPALPVPGPDALLRFPSVQLFVDRAQAARPGFQLTPENAAAVAALCDRLEGLPLALELAAAWAEVLTPEQMLPRLEKRFELLVSQRRDRSARHRTLRAALESSFQLLSPELQRCLACLSVFRGGWTLEAAEALCSPTDVLTCLRLLRARSLVVAEEVGDAQRITMRYRLLETVREFAAEQLSAEEQAALSRRHAEYFLASLQQELAHAEVCIADEQAALERLEREHDNLRAALAWSQSAEAGSIDLALALGGALGLFWSLRGYLKEGREQLERLLALDRQVGRTEAPGVSPAGHDRSLARSRVLARAGLIAGDQGDYTAMRAYYQESLSIRRRAAGGAKEIAYSLMYLGAAAREEGDLEAARSFFEEALGIERQEGAPGEPGCAMALGNLGGVAFCRGDLDAARRFYEESLSLFQRMGDRRGSAWVLHRLAMIAGQVEDRIAGRALEEKSLILRRELSSPQGIAECLVGFAELVGAQGEPARGARLLGAADALCETVGYRLPTHERRAAEQAISALRVAMGEQTFEAAWLQGRALTLEQAVEEALGGPPPAIA